MAETNYERQGDGNIPLNTRIDKERVIVETHENHPDHAHSEKHRAVHSEHHHHHHTHHTSGKKSARKKRKKGLRKFIKKYKKHLVYTALAMAFFLCAIVTGTYVDWMVNQRQNKNQTSTVANTENRLVIEVPVFDRDVSVVGPAAAAYLKGEEGVTVHNFYERYQGVDNRLDTGAPVELSYTIKGMPEGYVVKSARFTVTEQADGKAQQVIETQETSASFYNLKTGTAYDYRIDITFTNGVKSTVSGGFRTANGPRMMTLSGVYNMRDVGGWTTAEGKRIRQGLLYRGCEIDGAVDSKFTITKDGIRTMLNELNVKTDMDLRSTADNPYEIDKLGSGVDHIHYDGRMYEAVFDAEQGRKNLRKVFSDLADKSRYPIYMHCTYGQDRTGTVCYLLGGLLGVCQEDLIKDYELSALCHGYVTTTEMTAFVERVNQLPGETLSEKIEGYLLSVGVTPKEIRAIREIFL